MSTRPRAFHTPKGKSTRVAPLNDSLTNELRWYIADMDNPTPTSYLFTRRNRYTDYRIKPLSGSALMKLVLALGKQAGFIDEGAKRSWLTPHVLRKTAATTAHNRGVAPHITQQVLGHVRFETTQKHYIHLPTLEPLRQFGAAFE